MGWLIPGDLEDILTSVTPYVAAFLIAWFVNMAVVGWLAARKNRDSGFWSVLALFAGPIALAAILLARRRSRPVALSPLWEKFENEQDTAARRDTTRGEITEGRGA